MTQADNLLIKLSQMRKALAAFQRGMPKRLIVACYGGDAESEQQAVADVLDKYGLTYEEALGAGVEVQVSKLLHFQGRGIGITSFDDPRIADDRRKEYLEQLGGKPMPVQIRGTKQDLIERGIEND